MVCPVIDLAELTRDSALDLLAGIGATAAEVRAFRRTYSGSAISREQPPERAFLTQASLRLGQDAEKVCIQAWCAANTRARAYHATRVQDPSVFRREGLHAQRQQFWERIRAVAIEHPLGPQMPERLWAAARGALLRHHMVNLKMNEWDVFMFMDRRCIGSHGHTNPREHGPEFWQDLLSALQEYCLFSGLESKWNPQPLLTEGTLGCTVICEIPLRRLPPDCRTAVVSAVIEVSLRLFEDIPSRIASSMCLSLPRVLPDEIVQVAVGDEALGSRD
jgi:hypothetical protein